MGVWLASGGEGGFGLGQADGVVVLAVPGGVCEAGGEACFVHHLLVELDAEEVCCSLGRF